MPIVRNTLRPPPPSKWNNNITIMLYNTFPAPVHASDIPFSMKYCNLGPRPVLGLLVTATNQDIECITRERGRAFCWGHWEVAHSSRHEEQEYNHQEWNNPSEETPLHLPGSLHYVRLLRTKHPYIPIALAQWCMEFYEESEREEFTSLGKQFKSVQENIYNTSTLHV